MSDAFDPYYLWLGIPPAEQPADYYRLLGVSRFESNVEAITTAADRQIRHVETFKTGAHAKEAEKLLNKLATAKACLSDVEKKRIYDRAMSGAIGAENSPPIASDSPKAHSPKVATSRSRPRTRNPLVELAKIVLGGIAGLVIGMAILWYGFGMDVLGVMRPQRDVTANPAAEKQAAVPESRSRSQTPPVAIEPTLDVGKQAAKPLAAQPTLESHEVPSPPPQSKTDPGAAVEESTESPVVAGTLASTPESFRDVVQKLLGTWEVTYTNRTKNRRTIGTDGPLTSANGDILIDFDTVIERLTLVGDKLFVEHFNPKSTYPSGFAAVIGIGKKIDVPVESDSEEAVPVAIDLLSLVQLPRDNLRGRWKEKNGGLVSPAFASEQSDPELRIRPALEIPYDLPPNYRLKMIIERQTGTEGIFFHVPFGRRHVEVAFDLAGRFSGIDGVISSEVDYQHVALVRNSQLFEIAKPRTVEVVRRGDSLELYLDDVPFFPWNDDTLAIASRGGLINDKRRLILGGYGDSVVAYQKVELLPIEIDHHIATTSAEAPSTTPARAVVPAAAILATAETTVRAVFADEYGSAKTPPEKTALAVKLLNVGLETHDDSASRYVTIRSARNVAVESGNVDLAFSAIDAMTDSFEIDTLAEQAGLAEDLAKASLNDDETAKLRVRVVELREQAFDRDVYPVAVSLNDLSRRLGKGTDKQWREATDRWTKRLESGAAAFELVQAALKTLQSSPEDAAANLTVGRYRCLLKSEWRIGLPYLAKGSDEKLRAIAEREMASSDPTPNETLALADSWWDLAAELDGIEQPQVQMRAAQLYESALPTLSGLSAAKAEKRVRALRALGIDSNAVPLELPHRGPAPTDGASKSEFKVISNSIGMKLVLIPAGEFMMGAPEDDTDAIQSEQPQHLVRVAESFYMSTHEVTVEQFRQFADDSGYKTEAETDGIGGWGYSASMKDAERPPLKYSWRNTGFDQANDSPVVNVSWNDAVKFCEWLSDQPPSPGVYRLPSEMEWEYACRAGTTTRYYWGNDGESLNSRENVADTSLSPMLSETRKLLNLVSYASWNDGFPFAAPVGTFSANGFGLYDMHGNVSEWCQDAYDNYSNPEKAAITQQRVFRGGSFVYPLTHARSSQRHRFEPSERWLNLGFRVVRELDITP